MDTYNFDGDLVSALSENGLGAWLPQIAAVELQITGENEGPE